LARLREGKELEKEEEKGLVKAIDLALTAPGGSETERLTQVKKEAEEVGCPTVGLVMGGATKIKQYVFESAKLPEIRGASGLLDRINRFDLRALFGRPSDGSKQCRASEVRGEVSARHPGCALPDCWECVIYANGGEILAFAPTKVAPILCDEIEYLYTSETLVANSVAVWRECSLEELQFGIKPLQFWTKEFSAISDEDLKDLLASYYGGLEQDAFLKRKTFGELADALALEKLRRREGNSTDGRLPKSLVCIETNPYARRCESCDRRAAVVQDDQAAEPSKSFFCEPCARKRVFGQMAKGAAARTAWFNDAGFQWEPEEATAWTKRFEEWLSQDNNLQKTYYGPATKASVTAPDDLKDIADVADPPEYVGMVFADANNMGGFLSSLRTPDDYQQFAEEVYKATEEATFTALASHLHPAKGKHPFEILCIGGDDVLLIVPAQAALPIAVTIAEKASEELARTLPKFLAAQTPAEQWSLFQRVKADGQAPADQQSQIAFSSGVIIAQQHTPVFLLQRLAEELLKSAKKKAKELSNGSRKYYGATIDFASLKSIGMIATNVDDFRGRALKRDKLHLTARPYTIPEIKALLTTIKELKKSDFPRSQLYRLRQQIEKGWLASTVDYLYFRSRSADAESLREVLDEVWVGQHGRAGGIGLWLKRAPDEWETILGDLLEIYDFVSAEG